MFERFTERVPAYSLARYLTAVSMALAIVALGVYLPTFGTSTGLGLLGLLLAIPGLTDGDRGTRIWSWCAFILNAALGCIFVYVLLFFDVI